jgi:hypothetical protein
MVVSPILRGMFGLTTDAEKHEIHFAPHVPADWTTFGIHNVHVGGVGVDFQYRKTPDEISLEIKRSGTGDCAIEFSPAFSLRTKVVSVTLNGKPVPFKMQPNGEDQHLQVRLALNAGANNVVIRLKNDFGLTLTNELPHLGSSSRGLRIVDESWNASKDQLTLNVSGLAGARYELAVWNSAQISSVDGALLDKLGKLDIEMPKGAPEAYVEQKVILHFRRQ